MNFLVYLQPLTPTLSAILLAVLVDMVLRLIGQARDRIDPLLGIPSGVAGWLGRKLNREGRAKDVRLNRGIITLVVVLLVSIVLGIVFEILGRRFHHLQPVLWFLCLRATYPWSALRELLQAFREDARETVAYGLEILRRRRVPVLVPSAKPDKFAIARMGIEATATSLHRGLLSPVLWGLATALLHGPALLVAVMIVAFMEAERLIVTQENAGGPFAFGFEMIDAIVNFVPARIAALFWVLGALFTPGAHPLDALRAMFVKSAASRAANSGGPVAAMAGALHVALPGGKKHDLWISTGNATARAEAWHLSRALWLHAATLGLVVLVLSALLLLSIGL